MTPLTAPRRSPGSFAVSFLLVLLPLLVSPVSGQVAPPNRNQPFLRGDSNGDGRITLSDIVTVLRYLYVPAAHLPCADAADFDDSGTLNTTDIINLLSFIYYNAAFPRAPFPYRGFDLTPDEYDCESGSPETESSLELGLAKAVGSEEIPEELLDSGGLCDLRFAGQEVDFVRFANQRVQVYPGQEDVRVTVLLRNVAEIDGFTLSFYSAPGPLRLRRVSYEDTVLAELSPDWIVRLNHRASEGYLAAAVLMEYSPPFRGKILRRKCDLPIAQLEFSVSADAPIGEAYRVEFKSTPGMSENYPAILNEFSEFGRSKLPFLDSRGVTVEVVPQERFFVRADANFDGVAAMTDVVLTLKHLFLGEPISCLDPLDSDDDGEVGITDVVFSIQYLYTGGRQPPAPFPRLGIDPTPDAIGDGCL